jgi:hypothetical protein
MVVGHCAAGRGEGVRHAGIKILHSWGPLYIHRLTHECIATYIRDYIPRCKVSSSVLVLRNIVQLY